MNTSDDFRLTAVHPHEHLQAVAQITSDAFANGQYVEEIAAQYIGNSHYDWDVSRLVWHKGQLVHHWGVWGYPMRLDGVLLKVAGVGAVTTLPDYRQRGLMARAVLDSLRGMRENGYDLSILRGRHYVKFGYARAWNYVTYRLKAEELPELPAPPPYELLGPERMAEIEACYNQHYQAYSGVAVRPTYRMLQAGDMNAYGWQDADGQLAGYMRAVPTDDKKTLQCLEATGDAQQGLAVLGELFKAGAYETLAFFTLPHQHPILQWLRRGACVVEDRYFHNSGWRVRIVDLASALHKLRPRLEARLQRSWLAGWHGSLLLDAGEQQATLQIKGDKVQVLEAAESEHAIHGGAEIGRLLIGSDQPEEVLAQAQMCCTGLGAELACALFPNLHPVMSQWDEY
ncbi:MAG: GNAT family N-acetyltransferase [Chloroflexota bacterium]